MRGREWHTAAQREHSSRLLAEGACSACDEADGLRPKKGRRWCLHALIGQSGRDLDAQLAPKRNSVCDHRARRHIHCKGQLPHKNASRFARLFSPVRESPSDLTLGSSLVSRCMAARLTSRSPGQVDLSLSLSRPAARIRNTPWPLLRDLLACVLPQPIR